MYSARGRSETGAWQQVNSEQQPCHQDELQQAPTAAHKAAPMSSSLHLQLEHLERLRRLSLSTGIHTRDCAGSASGSSRGGYKPLRQQPREQPQEHAQKHPRPPQRMQRVVLDADEWSMVSSCSSLQHNSAASNLTYCSPKPPSLPHGRWTPRAASPSSASVSSASSLPQMTLAPPAETHALSPYLRPQQQQQETRPQQGRGGPVLEFLNKLHKQRLLNRRPELEEEANEGRPRRGYLQQPSCQPRRQQQQQQLPVDEWQKLLNSSTRTARLCSHIEQKREQQQQSHAQAQQPLQRDTQEQLLQQLVQLERQRFVSSMRRLYQQPPEAAKSWSPGMCTEIKGKGSKHPTSHSRTSLLGSPSSSLTAPGTPQQGTRTDEAAQWRPQSTSGRSSARSSGDASAPLPAPLSAPRQDKGRWPGSPGDAGDLCILCRVNRQEVVFLHGGGVHRCACRECAEPIKVGSPCPLCRDPITAILRVYSATSAVH